MKAKADTVEMPPMKTLEKAVMPIKPPSSTATMACPAVMFAKRRTVNAKGLTKMLKNSISQTSGKSTFGTPADLETQQWFFDRHLAPWARLFFEDLESANSARFYKPVGTVGRLFMEIETTAFEMAA